MNSPASPAAQAFDAVRAGDHPTLLRLLDGGVSVETTNARGDALLMLAAYHGHTELVATLLARGADPNRANASGQFPLAGAVFKGDVAIADLLLAAGAVVDTPDKDGRTALHYAAMFDHADLVALLLAKGADRAIRDASGLGPADAARARGARNALAVFG
jgi:ankyrin repeat protein